MTKDEITRALRICGNSRKCTECPLGDVEFCLHIMTTCAANLIEQQAARIAELEAKAPRWIPVTERLPEVHQNTRKSEAMLVYTRRKLFMVAIWNGIDWLAPMDFWDAWGDEIVYWMPLPEAPKEGA